MSPDGIKRIALVVGMVVVAIIWLLSTPTDNETWTLVRTLALGLSAAVVAIPLGSGLALLCFRRSKLARLLTFSVAGLLFFPLFLHVSLWDAAFGKLGWLTSTRGQVLTPLVSGWTAAAWIHGIAAAPQVALIFLLGLNTGQLVLEEQASLDAGRVRVFFQVTLWHMLPLALLSLLWVVVICAREISVTDLYQIGTLAEQLYLGYSLGSVDSIAGNWSPDQRQSASEFQSGVSLLIPAGLAFIASLWIVNLTKPRHSHSQWQPPKVQQPTKTSQTLTLFFMFFLLIVPLGNVIYRCGFVVRPVDGLAVGGFSAAQFCQSIHRALTNYTAEFVWSFLIAFVSSICILATAIAVAWLALNHRRWRYVLVCLLAICLTIPGPLIGTSLAALFSEMQVPLLIWLYDRTILAPVVASSIFCWPPAALLTWFLFSRINPEELESAKLDSASQWKALFQIGLRGRYVAWAGCWLLTFALCFGELSASQLVLPPGMDTLPRLMLGLLHAGVDEMTAGLALVISFGIAGLSLLGYVLLRIGCFELESAEAK